MPKVRDAIRFVESDGWVIDRMRGSHRIFLHPTKSGEVVIPGHPSKDLRVKTWRSILKQAGLREERR